MKYCAYLDIETTGLSPLTSELTVIGLHIEDGADNGVIQIVGEEISASRLKEAVKEIKTLYTYNGSRFDLPFMREKLGIDIPGCCNHKDLMYACWEQNLYGGLKAVERQLGIERKFPDIDGWVAVQLWFDFKQNGNQGSLKRLLQYNEEDVLNLRVLRDKLEA
jgi:uncharacterized protein YprB with RNaseH-like and TPR domain